ncbi:MAG: MbnP family protein [Flavipsychrobacter sp.]
MKKAICTLTLLSIAAIGAMFSSCEKSPTVWTPANGTVKMQFTYVWGKNETPLALEQKVVQEKTGDTLIFTNIRYYVSNIKLKRADGVWWSMPDSYFLLDAQSAEASTITIPDIPFMNYTAVQYTMGVDSLHNVSGAQTGALSLQNGMFWDWNSGYIMMKAEGRSPNSPTGSFALHMGGFSGQYNVVTVNTAEFGKTVQIGNGANPTITMVTNPSDLWDNAPSVKVNSVIHMPGAYALAMAKGFYGGIYLSTVSK